MPFDFQLLERVPLASRTTFELGGEAAFLSEIHSVAQLEAALQWARSRGVATWVLGAGSNVIVPDGGFDGLVLAMQVRGRSVEARGDRVYVRVAAGESFDELVAWSVDEHWQGLECLSGIPGLVGATPVQNVGAYGQEVADTIASVDVVELATGARRTISANECEFGYRDSLFKRAGQRFAVTEVQFVLRRETTPSLRYGELATRLKGQDVTLSLVRETVLELRRAKSMVYAKADPNHRSAGSFFTNPIVSAPVAADVVSKARAQGVKSDVPRWPLPDGRVKLAAGWLIENAGFYKGFRAGQVGLSTAHALALVHHGEGSTAELLAFAERIVAGVRHAFGVVLEREPVLMQHAR